MVQFRRCGILLTIAWVLTLALALPGSYPAAAQQAARPVKLAVLGDSLTAGLGLAARGAFPAQLERALRERGHQVEVLNAGVSGDTASGGRDRLDWSIPDGTDGVIVELGANDALRGVDPKTTRAALDAILARLKARGMAALLTGMMAPPNYGGDYVAQFNAIYPELAQKHGVPLYAFFLEGVAAEAALNQSDGIHPTERGVARIVTGILPAVEKFIAGLPVRN